MLVLVLGSNVGDRLSHLRKALQAIKNIPGMMVQQVSPLYLSDALLPENAPPEWDRPYINLALRCHTHLTPLDLLDKLKTIESCIGRKPTIRHWGPRVIDIDILAWDDKIINNERLHIPHDKLQDRPFALWPLADVAPLWIFPLEGPHHGETAAHIVEKWGSRFDGNAPLHTRQIYQRIDTPQIVGILNITPDSFSDGHLYLDPASALKKAQELVASGAEIIDIGAESTSPTAQGLTIHTEWSRLEPVLAAIKAAKHQFLLEPKLSIDTYHPETVHQAVDFGIHWINDVSGLDHPAMREIALSTGLDCVIMHHLHIPERRQHILDRSVDPTHAVYTWGEKRLNELEKQGIARERLIFDPGIGFGKAAEQSLILLKNVQVFKQLGIRMLIGHSRKTFFSLLSHFPFAERDLETTIISLFLAQQSVDYLRVHDALMCARALRVAATMVPDHCPDKILPTV